MSDWNTWTISPDDRAKFDSQFQLLRPDKGYLTGEQLKSYFLKFGLSVPVLGHIWGLADMDVDGKMDQKEFAIAMFLINKSLSHVPLPPTLPLGLKNSPTFGFVSPISPRNTLSSQSSATVQSSFANGDTLACVTTQSNGSLAQRPDFQNWIVSPESRPKYRLLFNQHDHMKRGYLTGLEARAIFIKSGLSQQILAHIWSLADVDKDGNLSGDEFCIATFLIDKALAGNPLPPTLPSSLLSSVVRSSSDQKPTPAQEDGVAPASSFEDKRRENFLQGQIELDKRKQELAEKMRFEEESRLEKERLERERLERIRREEEERKSAEAARQAEKMRELEAQKEARRRQAFEERTKAWRLAESQRLIEAERQRVETLKRDKSRAQTLLEQAIAHRASLLESASVQEQRRRDVSQRLLVATNELNSHKDAITSMRSKRDTYEREIRDLTEQVEAAKADLARVQREKEELTLRQSTTSSNSELYKSLLSSQSLHRQDIDRLNRTLDDLNARTTNQGQELARRRNAAQELEQKSSVVQSELNELRTLLHQKLRATATHETPSGDNASETISALCDAYDVMFNFTARHPDELSLVVGSSVRVYANPPVTVAPGWLYGESDGRKGLFPESYVRKREAGKIDPFDPFGVHRPVSSVANASETGSVQQSSFADSYELNRSKPTELSSPSVFAGSPLFTCVALYPFDSTVAGDLALNVGDVVRVYKIRDQWWEGVNDRTKLSGLFPANFAQKISHEDDSSTNVGNYRLDLESATEFGQVNWPDAVLTESEKAQFSPDRTPTNSSQAIIDQPKSDASAPSDATFMAPTTKPELARVIAPYTATSAGQLSLQPGQLVQVRKRSPKGWWEGELQQRGKGRQYGWFPADYVKLITQPSSNGSSKESAGSSTVSSPVAQSALTTPEASSVQPTVERMQAIFSYKAAHADELTFDEGDIITVLGRDEPEWWRGRLKSTGAEGLFPVNYVRPCQQNSSVKDSEISRFGFSSASSTPKS